MLREEPHLAGIGGPQLHRHAVDLDGPRLGDIDADSPGPPSVAIEAQIWRTPGREIEAGPEGCRVRPVGDARPEPLEPRTAAHVDERCPAVISGSLVGGHQAVERAVELRVALPPRQRERLDRDRSRALSSA